MNQMTQMETAQMYLLCQAEGIGQKTIQKLLERFGTAEAVLGGDTKEMQDLLTIRQRDALKALCGKGEAARRYEAFLKTGLSFVPFTAAEYPARLREIPDPPKALYVRGMLPPEEIPQVAVIGARICSEYGRYMARLFGAELAQAGVHVVSGMALGVDSIAQRAALKAGGGVTAVLGCGADVCYPPENRDLYDSLCMTGCVISEYAPGTQPQRHLFPPRNRIISGLADAVLVIEARAKSGTLITVDMALEQGRDVYALPGRATDRLSDGCNALIKQGAVLATGVADIMESFYGIGTEISHGKERTDEGGKQERQTDAGQADAGRFPLPERQRRILEVLDLVPKSVADVECALSLQGDSFAPQELMCMLVELSLKGLVEQEGSFFLKKI
ncbi:MAG: DNA-processing protein DprA [Lachnospiraceae bacterium]|nr:DNA-processing protein DprA [Lachnospiraceae bacterium]